MKNLVEEITDELRALLPDCEEDLLRLYTLLVLERGLNTTPKSVHNAWMVWRTRTRPDHPSIVPFRQLPPHEQAKDNRYANAIVAVAKMRLAKR